MSDRLREATFFVFGTGVVGVLVYLWLTGLGQCLSHAPTIIGR